MNGSPVQLALREMQRLVTSPAALGGMALAIVLLTVSGPFGTFADLGTSERFAYWALVVGLTYALGRGTVTLIAEALRGRIPAYWPRLIVAALVAAVPVGVIVLGVNRFFYAHLSVEMALRIWFYVAVVTLTITAVFGAIGVRQRHAEAAQPQAAPAPAEAPQARAVAPILERVPLPQRGQLLALSVEDHYVDIVTDRGKTLVLMRLADAMRETGSVDGLQVHRSHWVARAAVVKTYRADGKVSLELSNGMRLPVSRGFLPQVRAAGLG